MAIHALGWGEAGYKLWVDRSRNSEKFNEDDQLKTWQSFDHEREAGAPRICEYATIPRTTRGLIGLKPKRSRLRMRNLPQEG
jgi:hypothetical protein